MGEALGAEASATFFEARGNDGAYPFRRHGWSQRYQECEIIDLQVHNSRKDLREPQFGKQPFAQKRLFTGISFQSPPVIGRLSVNSRN
jgi:hypothetical protein